jgi:predicted metal-binding membrane protein
VGSSELGPIYRRTGHPLSCRPRHTDRVIGRRSEEWPLTARIRRRQTTAALSAVRAHRGTEGSNLFPSSGESNKLGPAIDLRHRRAVVLGALATVTAAAWTYLLLGVGTETDMDGGQMMVTPSAWSPRYAVLICVMWWVMMVAMMLPTAAPTVLLVTTLAWDRLSNSNIPATALLFASGYLLVWSSFSLAATLMQWGLDSAGLLSETMAFDSAILVSTVLITSINGRP